MPSFLEQAGLAELDPDSEVSKERRRRERVERCGKYFDIFTDPETLQVQHRPRLCDNYRLCDNCWGLRRDGFLAEFAKIDPAEWVVYTYEQSSAASKAIRKLDGIYKRLPCTDGLIRLVAHISRVEDVGGNPAPLTSYNFQDPDTLELLFRTPARQRITGNLLPPEEEEEEEESSRPGRVVEVTVKNYEISKEDKKMALSCAAEARRKLGQFNVPLEDAQEGVELFERALEHLLWYRHIDYSISYRIKREVREGQMAWGQGTQPLPNNPYKDTKYNRDPTVVLKPGEHRPFYGTRPKKGDSTTVPFP